MAGVPPQHDRVVELLRSHRIRISRAWARQVRAVVPRYAQIDNVALERNLANLLVGFERALATSDERQLMASIANVTQMRLATGFVVPELLVATVCFLAVIRRFILEKASSIEDGLDDFEALEAVCLPLLGRVSSVFLESSNDTMPGGWDIAKFRDLLSGESGPFPRVRIERVTGDDSDENTPTDFFPPGSLV